MKAMEYVLGIDVGTGSVKAVAVDGQGRALEDCQQHYPFNVPRPGYHEQDPEQIWNGFIASIQGIIDKTGSQPLAIGLSSAMHSLIAVDENCVPLAPMMTWADNRSAAVATRIKATPQGIAVYEATGTPIHAMSPLCKIVWTCENNPKLFHATYKFISIKEYIWYKLFNEFTVDHSIASGTGLFDILALKWNNDALKLAGITSQLLSAPVPTDYHKKYEPGTALPESGSLKPGVMFIIGASDGCLANLGSMAIKPGIASITIGTSGAVRVASNKPLPNVSAMTFSYILDKSTFICGGPINNGGVAMQWWLKNITETMPSAADYEQLFNQIAAVPPGSNGLIFLPYLTGERAPIWDSDSCGNFFGIKLQHTGANFSRAVMEGICYALRSVLEAVQQNAEPIMQVNVSGGFTRSDIWVQTLADVTGKKLVIIQADDASAVGAAYMAQKKIGLTDEYPASAPANQKVFMPEVENAAVHQNNFVIYQQLYTVLKETMHHRYAPGI